MDRTQELRDTRELVLSLRGISKHFGAVSALTDIDLDVHAGEVVALVGDNGAGKSTLVKILAGVHQPSSGTITFRGKPVTLADPSAALGLGIATVFQDLALCENLDVVANIFLGRELSPYRLDEVSMELKAWTLLNELSARIPSVREPVASLSGGQRQTVAIARSLLLEPKLILLDEPTAALGVAQTAEVLDLIERVRDRGLGVIMISHNMEDVRAVADRIVVLRLGRNNGVFEPDASNQELVSAITGAANNSVSRRASRRQAQAGKHRRRRTPMTKGAEQSAQAAPLLDRSDERVKHAEGIGGSIRAFWDRVRSGDLGSLPVVVGLAIIWTVFQSLNPVFLAPNNLVNLLFDCSTVGVIALGIVCILIVGEIDLSVGSVSGFASALVGVLWVNQGWPVSIAILAALLFGALIGALYAVLFNRFGMPSFVSTLAGLLSILGLQLYLLGSTGSINLPYESPLVNFGQMLVMPDPVSYALAALPGIVMFVLGYRTAARRREAGLSSQPLTSLLLRSVVVTVVLEFIVYYLNLDRGIPWMFGLFVGLVAVMNYALTRTKWGRQMLAVGGNREAARRAGINVRFIYTTAFVLCSGFAAAGGVLAAARLASASQQAGTGDVNLNAIAAAVIGGTSLFGGRGSAYSALLGIIVIQSIASGLTLLDLSSSLRYMITGAVLAIAVIVDSLARRSRASHGRA